MLGRVAEHLDAADELLEEALRDPDMKQSDMTKRMTAFSDMMKHAKRLREEFVSLLERQRRLVDLDEVLAAVGREASEARRHLRGHGKRMAGQMTLDVKRNSELLDEDIDIALSRIDGMKHVAEKVFAAPDPDAVTEADAGGLLDAINTDDDDN